MNKAEVDLLIMTVNSLINLVTFIDPALGDNKAIQDLKSALTSLQALGL